MCRMANGWPASISHAHDSAAALHQQDVAPASIAAGDTLATADHAESVPLMQGDGRDILGEDTGLQCPDTGGFRSAYQLGQQRRAHTPAASAYGDIHADLGDARIYRARRHRTERGESDHAGVLAGDEPAIGPVRRVPALPLGRGR